MFVGYACILSVYLMILMLLGSGCVIVAAITFNYVLKPCKSYCKYREIKKKWNNGKMTEATRRWIATEN